MKTEFIGGLSFNFRLVGRHRSDSILPRVTLVVKDSNEQWQRLTETDLTKESTDFYNVSKETPICVPLFLRIIY